jgi:hypothetical protein
MIEETNAAQLHTKKHTCTTVFECIVTCRYVNTYASNAADMLLLTCSLLAALSQSACKSAQSLQRQERTPATSTRALSPGTLTNV